MAGLSTDRREASVADVWGEDEEEISVSLESLVLEREWDARRNQFHTLGYRDGIIAGKEYSLQEGFDSGFKEAAVAGLNWGIARGVTSAVAALPSLIKDQQFKVPNGKERIASLHLTISNISSSEAMGFYYEDSILRRRGLEAGGVEGPTQIAKETNSSRNRETSAGGGSNLLSTNHLSICDTPIVGGDDRVAVASSIGSNLYKFLDMSAYHNYNKEIERSETDIHPRQNAQQVLSSTRDDESNIAVGEGSNISSEICGRLEHIQRRVNAELPLSSIGQSHVND